MVLGACCISTWLAGAATLIADRRCERRCSIVAARPITAALASCHCCKRNFDYLGLKLILQSDLRRRAASRRALSCPSSCSSIASSTTVCCTRPNCDQTLLHLKTIVHRLWYIRRCTQPQCCSRIVWRVWLAFRLRIRSLTSQKFTVVRVVLYGVPPYRYLDQSYTFHSYV